MSHTLGKEEKEQGEHIMEKISRKSFVKGALGLGAVGILAGCASSASSTAASASSTAAPAEKKEFTFADTVRWDAQYDVVVMGMGAAVW